jgi:hypothetical protein
MPKPDNSTRSEGLLSELVPMAPYKLDSILRVSIFEFAFISFSKKYEKFFSNKKVNLIFKYSFTDHFEIGKEAYLSFKQLGFYSFSIWQKPLGLNAISALLRINPSP